MIQKQKNRVNTRPNKKAPLPVKQFIPYRLNMLAGVVSEGFVKSYAQYSTEFGIDGPEWRVMSFLGELIGSPVEQQGMTARDIGARTRMQKVKVSRAIAALEGSGLIVRQVNQNDRREAFLNLTEAGAKVYWTIVPVATKYQQTLVEGLSEEDLNAFDRVVSHFQAQAAQLLAIGSASNTSPPKSKVAS